MPITKATPNVISPISTTNLANSIVLRDASGNFSAGTITAALTGNASSATTATSATSATSATTATTAGSCTGNSATATALQTPRTIALTGSVTGSASFDGSANISIATTGATSAKAFVIVSTTSAAGGGTDMTIIDSYNVSSVTKIIGGIYQVNFTNSLNSATYVILASASNTSNGDVAGIAPVLAPVTNYTQGGTQYGTTPTQNNFRFAAYYSGGSVAAYDRVSIMVS